MPFPDTESVLAFLNSLDPAQPALLQVFMEMGVITTADLGGLSRMGSRDKWLYSWAKRRVITEFQYELIRAGLEARSMTAPK